MKIGLGLGFGQRRPGIGGGGMAIGFSASRDEGTVGDLYVAKTGSDANPGTFGSPKLTISGAMAVATSGQEIKVRAGTYRETVSFAGKSGTSGNRTTISRYGNEEVIISAAEPLSGFVACTIADQPDVGANWANMFKVTVPLTNFVGSDPRSAHPYEAGVRLLPAMSWAPNPMYPDQEGINDQWWTSDLTVTSGGLITGYQDASVTSLFTTAQIENADVLFHYSPNLNGRTKVASFTGSTINLTDTTRTYESNSKKDTYALINILPAMQRGQWGFRISGSDAILYVWPNNPGTINSTIEITRRGQCIEAAGTSHVEVRGLILERASSAGASTDGFYAYNAGGTTKLAGHVLENCLFRDTYRAGQAERAPVWLGNIDNWRIERCTSLNAYNQFGFFPQGSQWNTSGMAQNGRMLYCEAINAAQAGFRMYGQENCLVAFCRAYRCGNGAHANKTNFYVSSHRVTYWGCDFRGSSGYLTWQEASSIVVGFCDVPVSYNGTDGRAIVDQNLSGAGDQSPATEQAISGLSYILNNMTAPYGPAIAQTDSISLGVAAETQVTYSGKNNIFHGASGVDELRLTASGWRNNVMTSGAALASSAGTDTTALPADVYENTTTGNTKIKSTSPTRSASTASIAAEVAILQSWYPDQSSIFTKDLTGATFNPSSPPMGPYVNPDNQPALATIWVDRPVITGSLTDGSVLTVSGGYYVGTPHVAPTYQWLTSPDQITWTNIVGQTGTTYTTSGNVGLFVGVRTTANGVSVISSSGAVIAFSYPLGNPVAKITPVVQSNATAAIRQIETPSFSVSNKPLLVTFHFTEGSSTDIAATITVGTSGRAFGTGTTVPFVARARRTTTNSLIHGVIAPGSGTVTVQCEAAAAISSYRIEVIEIDGATSFVGGTAAGATGVSTIAPTITTGAANGIAFYMAAISNPTNANPTTVAGATEFSQGTTGGTLSTDRYAALAWEQVPSAGAATCSFSWAGGTANVAAVAVEVRS